MSKIASYVKRKEQGKAVTEYAPIAKAHSVIDAVTEQWLACF